MIPDEDVVVDTGRCEGGTFVRVRHVPTGRSRTRAPLGGERHEDVVRRLRAELEAELGAEGREHAGGSDRDPT